jgi:hypothetical protein
MSATAIGCAIMALMARRGPRDGAGADDEPR